MRQLKCAGKLTPQLLTLLEMDQQQTTPRSYAPHQPFAKQRTFLELTCQEAFYGGGAGPGKTEALLMAALQYVHVPGYAALLLRRDFARLALPGSIMDRAKQWLTGSDARWNEQRKTWSFPSGATLQFGYIDSPDDRYRYASTEFQFIGWDELTEFRLADDESNPYLFMFSRLRKTRGLNVPVRMRSASNPGGTGHAWVKNRFISPKILKATAEGSTKQVFFNDAQRKDRAFVPALLHDNPAIDAEAYVARLSHLPPVTRQRLIHGDWSVREEAILRGDWFRYYTQQEGTLSAMQSDSTLLGTVHEGDCTRFAVLDTAGGTKDKTSQRKGKPGSFSALGIWDYAPNLGNALFLRHVWRDRVEFVPLCENVVRICQQWKVPILYLENAHHGQAVENIIRDQVPTRLISPATGLSRGGVPGKVERSYALQNKLSRGEIFLPKHNNQWLLPYEQELLGWTGHEDDVADQVDISSYAAILCETNTPKPISPTYAASLYGLR
ncbi:hypothetical protein AB1L30_05280 [Bremerella sp. JC817]|uniref:hypothetical protein n=1 Tax=Bremerella sp. JC817 TaxID=3231756 RepID=UPI0034579E8C